jgi:hypothetical protein
MYPEAFGGARLEMVRKQPNKCESDAHKPIARAKFRKPASVSTAGELRPEMMTLRGT